MGAAGARTEMPGCSLFEADQRIRWGGEKQRVDRRWAAGCAWHCPCMGKSANLGQLALNKRALNAGRQACDAQNLGHNCAHAVGLPIRN